MKKNIRILSLLLCCLLIAGSAFAASPWTSGSSYGEKMTGKLEFGLKNTLTGWTAIFRTMSKYQEDGKFGPLGFFEGLHRAVLYTVGGALHLATFPITVIDVPVLDNGITLD